MKTWTLDRFHMLVTHMRVAQHRCNSRKEGDDSEHEWLLKTTQELEQQVDVAIDEIATRERQSFVGE
jgi:hypothetical protein